MKILDIKLNELKVLLNRFEFDELTLIDLSYFDEQFEEIVDNIRELKNDIVNDRFSRSLDNLEKEL